MNKNSVIFFNFARESIYTVLLKLSTVLFIVITRPSFKSLLAKMKLFNLLYFLTIKMRFPLSYYKAKWKHKAKINRKFGDIFWNTLYKVVIQTMFSCLGFKFSKLLIWCLNKKIFFRILEFQDITVYKK